MRWGYIYYPSLKKSIGSSKDYPICSPKREERELFIRTEHCCLLPLAIFRLNKATYFRKIFLEREFVRKFLKRKNFWQGH